MLYFVVKVQTRYEQDFFARFACFGHKPPQLHLRYPDSPQFIKDNIQKRMPNDIL